MNIHKVLKRIKELGGIYCVSDVNDNFSVEIPAGVCGMNESVVFKAKKHIGFKRNRLGKSSHPVCWGYAFKQKDWDWDTHSVGYLAKNKTDVLEHFLEVMEKRKAKYENNSK